MPPDLQGVMVARAGIPELSGLFQLAANAFANEPGWNPRRVAEVLASDEIWIARVRDATAGYMAIAQSDDGWRIDQLLVASGHEQRGIGTLLLAYAEALADRAKVPSLSIVCEQRNFRAQDLYRRFGFAPVERELWMHPVAD